MKKLSFLCLFLLLIDPAIQAQTFDFQWAAGFGGPGPYTESGRDVQFDGDGNMYVTGRGYDSFDVDPGPGVTTLTATSYSQFGGVVVKYDSAGNLLWGKMINANYLSESESITLDDDQNLYMVGNYQDTIDLDPGPGTDLRRGGAPLNFNTYDAFMVKLDDNGDYQWGVTMFGDDVFADKVQTFNDRVYVGGRFSGTVDFNPGGGGLQKSSSGSFDLWLSCFDTTGTLLWNKTYLNANSGTNLHDMELDAQGNIYIMGTNQDSLALFDGGTPFYLFSPTIHRYVAKIDPTGITQWATNFGFISNWDGMGVTAAGEVYATGYFEDTVDFNPDGTTPMNLTSNGGYDVYIVKLDQTGDVVWVRSIGSGDTDTGWDCSTDALGNCYVTGYISDTCDMDPGAGVATLIPSLFGGFTLTNTGFLLKLDPAGNYLAHAPIGRDGQTLPTRLAVSDDALLVTGRFSNTVDFDHGPGTMILNGGGSNFFIARYAPGLTTAQTKPIETQFALSPNPAQDFLRLEGIPSGPCKVRLLDLQGRTMAEWHSSGKSQLLMAVSTVPNGLYFVQLTETDGTSTSRKVIIQR
jgi:hypothetical protein